MPEGITKKLKATLKHERGEANFLTGLEKRSKFDKNELPWNVYGHESVPYEYTFKNLFENGEFTTFDDWATKRKEHGKPVFVLDLMGTGNFMNVYDTMVAVTLFDMQDKPPIGDKSKYIIEGNIYTGSIWHKIERCINEHKFDLITCRPYGAFLHQTDKRFVKRHEHAYTTLYTMLLQRAYELLSFDDGLLLSEIPDMKAFNNEVISHYIELLTKSGVKANYSQSDKERFYQFKLEKNHDSPMKLPLIDFLLSKN
ncbi:MAG: hypothetical protein HY564_03420 [Candidatus Jacksonbacteria bacterium]|nr:hypothetical protein [Candidatus Jacksonbacteria bacterium]